MVQRGQRNSRRRQKQRTGQKCVLLMVDQSNDSHSCSLTPYKMTNVRVSHCVDFWIRQGAHIRSWSMRQRKLCDVDNASVTGNFSHEFQQILSPLTWHVVVVLFPPQILLLANSVPLPTHNGLQAQETLRGNRAMTCAHLAVWNAWYVALSCQNTKCKIRRTVVWLHCSPKSHLE